MDNKWRVRLIELITCLICLGLLASLVLPGVQVSRSPSRRTICRNRLKQLVTAATTFETSRGYFPGFQNRGISETKPGTWAIYIFPYMEQEPLVEEWKRTGKTDVFVSTMVCPSSTVEEFDGPLNNYVVNAGYYPRVGDPGIYGADADRNGISDYWDHPLYDLSNGVFHDRLNFPGVKMSARHIKDGMSQTVLFSENIQAMPWDTGAKWSDAGDGPLKRMGTTFHWLYALERHAPLPDNHKPTLLLPEFARINGGLKETQWTPILARPSSHHPGGVNVAFGDGHVTFVSQDISYHVWQALMTPNGKASDQPLRQFELSPTDY